VSDFSPTSAAGSCTPGVIERVLRALSGILAAIGAAALAGLFLVVLVAVVMRYFWGRPYAGSEELAGLLMTVAVFSLLPLTVLRDQHIRVSVVSDRLGRGRRLAYIVGQIVMLAFVTAFVRQAWAIADFTAKLNLLAEQSRLPLAPFLYLCVSAMALAGVVAAWRMLVPTAGVSSSGPPAH
jgi:TRAP-type C4-dicarboxylate transport system permease small subunit